MRREAYGPPLATGLEKTLISRKERHRTALLPLEQHRVAEDALGLGGAISRGRRGDNASTGARSGRAVRQHLGRRHDRPDHERRRAARGPVLRKIAIVGSPLPSTSPLNFLWYAPTPLRRLQFRSRHHFGIPLRRQGLLAALHKIALLSYLPGVGGQGQGRSVRRPRPALKQPRVVVIVTVVGGRSRRGASTARGAASLRPRQSTCGGVGRVCVGNGVLCGAFGARGDGALAAPIHAVRTSKIDSVITCGGCK